MIVFKFADSLVEKSRLFSTAKRLVPELKRIAKALYDSQYASVLLSSDGHVFEVVRAAAHLKKKLHPDLLVVVGIGGSNLGAQAVQEAVLGRQYNLNSQFRVLWADTVDPDALSVVILEMQNVLRSGRQVLLNVISKSGSTTETVANFEVLYNVLRRHRKNADEFVVTTTDRDSKLWSLALKKGFSLLEIPKNVGGRYSVFSPVGLFPLAMLGVDIKALREGACWALDQCLSLDVRKNPAAIGASLLHIQSKLGVSMYDNFIFSVDLEGVGKWYRQLLAESLGKEFDVKGKRVNAGITPLVSVGSVDLHSMAQLYLGGPRDKFTNFVSVHFNNSVKVPFYPEFDSLVPHLQRRELNKVMHAIEQGVKSAYRKQKHPFTETRLRSKDAFSIGAFMQLKMIETILLGHLLNVNPFDQPAVELYKDETRKLLRESV